MTLQESKTVTTMERLEQVKVVANNIKTSSMKAIKALHKLVFEEEGDRGNRKRLREFVGFAFASDSEEYKRKLTYADTHLGWGDLVAICNILAIDYSGTKKKLTQRICGYLMDFDALSDTYKAGKDASDDNDDDDEEDANDDGDEDTNEDRAEASEDENEEDNEDEDDRSIR